MKNKFVMGLFVLIVVLSLLVPKIVLSLLEDRYIEQMDHTRVLESIKEESVLIKTIYSKYNGEKYRVSINDTYEVLDGETLKNEELIKLQELENVGMIQNHFFTYLVNNKSMIVRINTYQNDSMNYKKIRIFLPTNDFRVAFMSFEVEHTTGKIIALKIPKEYVDVQRDVMKDYVNYLGFSKSDWIYEANSIQSMTNRLEIKVEEINNIVSISVVPYHY